MKSIFILIVVVLCVFSTCVSAEKPQKSYYYDSKLGKDLALAKVSGSDCTNLVGVYAQKKRGPTTMWEAIKIGNDYSKDFPVDYELRESFRKSPSPEGKFFCFPYVKDISHYLDASKAHVKDNSLELENGPLLIYYGGPESRKWPYLSKPSETRKGLSEGAVWIRDSYIEIKDISKCTEYDNEFCVEIDLYYKSSDANGIFYTLTARKESVSYHGRYRLLCWECDKIAVSPQALQKSILFREYIPYFSNVYALSGGFMVPEGSLDGGDLLTTASETAATKPSESLEKWRFLRQLAKVER